MFVNRIQVAGGLAIHRIQQGNFSDILKPAANTLILTGDCLAPGDPINATFREYLLNNWRRVIYIAGASETSGGARVPFENSPFRLQYAKKPMHAILGFSRGLKLVRFVGAPHIDRWPSEFKNKDGEWIKQQDFSAPEVVTILASNGKLPPDCQIENRFLLQGCAEYNNFNVNRGPITNSRTDFNGLPRSSYRPDFTIEVDPPSLDPNLIVSANYLQFA